MLRLKPGEPGPFLRLTIDLEGLANEGGTSPTRLQLMCCRIFGAQRVRVKVPWVPKLYSNQQLIRLGCDPNSATGSRRRRCPHQRLPRWTLPTLPVDLQVQVRWQVAQLLGLSTVQSSHSNQSSAVLTEFAKLSCWRARSGMCPRLPTDIKNGCFAITFGAEMPEGTMCKYGTGCVSLTIIVRNST